MKKAYIVRIFFALVILGLSLLAFKAAYHLTIKYYENDNSHIKLKEEDDITEQSKDYINTSSSPLFLLLEKEGYVIIEYFNGGELYDETDIKVIDLPQNIQEDLLNGISIKNFDELYDFLENFSS